VVEDGEVLEVQEVEEEYEIIEEEDGPHGAITTGPSRKAGKKPRAGEVTGGPARRPRKRPRLRGDDEDEGPSRDRPRKRRSLDVRKRGNSQLAEIFGGLGMMVGAVVWFVLGLMVDRIFFYPPILFVFGVIAFIRGMMGGSRD
jgi:hypothetical protein